MRDTDLHERLGSLEQPLGSSRLSLLIGLRRIDLCGLDRELAESLQKRWGGFVVEAPAVAPSCTARFFRAGPETWLDRWAPGEVYRIEPRGDAQDRLVASYHFALQRAPGASDWRVGVTDDPDERRDRIVDNVARFLAAHLALDDGGFAMHAAGLLREGRAYLFAGPSRAGKSTASRLVAMAQSLGDDFGAVVRGEAGWMSPAVPFDNSERVSGRPSTGLYPVAGIWRLNQALTTRVESGEGVLPGAALISCAAFAWAMPERADELLENVRRFVGQGLFHELFFTRDADLWPHLAG
jgi:hypothetical protein